MSQWSILRFSPGTDLQQVRASLAQNSLVSIVQLDYILTKDWIPTDSSFNQLWGLNNTGQIGGVPDADIDAPEAWDLQRGSKSVVVAVVDTGVDYNHSDLAANMWRNLGEVAGNGFDDDGNGFVDDVHGYDFINRDSNPMDDDGHGTHVAGTIGAVGNNNLGIVGVSPNVSLMALKFLGAGTTGGTTSDAAKAIDYAVRMGANIVNASFGGNSFFQPLADAISRANSAGVLVVAAAGNDGRNADIAPRYPASYALPNIISVAATTNSDQLATFSNFGASNVDMGAPGHFIWSTLPNNQYGFSRGTSMATPHVVGAAALLKAQNPSLTPSQLKNILMSSGDPISALQGVTVSGRRLNVFNAISRVVKPTIAVTASDAAAAETLNGQSTNPGQFTLTRTGNTASALTVNYTLSGSATNGSDYMSLNGSTTFAAGSSTATVFVNPVDDSIVESNETVTLLLSSNSVYDLSLTNSATVSIADNDVVLPTISLTATDSIAGETLAGQPTDPGQFTLTRTGNTTSSLIVNYTILGTAINSLDYSSLNGNITFAPGFSTATIFINPIDDSIIENNETVTLSLNSSSDYSLSSTSSASVTVVDNDLAPSVDRAGNTLATARSAVGGGNMIFSDFVGDEDTNDFYQFNISSDRNFNVTLTGMNANANVQLIRDDNSNGVIDEKEVLAISQNTGSTSESFNLQILTGSYYLRVYPGSAGNNTNYTINFQVTNLNNPSSVDSAPVQSYFGATVTRSFFDQGSSGNPSIYQSQYGRQVMYGPVAAYYTNNNFQNPNAGTGLFGIYSGLGLPTSPIYVRADGTQVMEFEGGSLSAQGSSVTALYNRRSSDRFDLVGVGAPNGSELLWKNDYSYWGRVLGNPLNTVQRLSNGWIQEFNSDIFLLKDGQQVLGGFDSYTNNFGQTVQIPRGGPYRVGGTVLNLYRSVGGYSRQNGGLGFPTMSQELSDYNGYRYYQSFENGFIAETYQGQVMIRNWQGQAITP